MRRWMITFGMLLLAGGVLADSTFQATDSWWWYSWKYPNGEYRMPWNNRFIMFSDQLSDTTGYTVAADSSISFVTLSGDSAAVYGWRNVPTGIYSFVETTGLDSLFAAPHHLLILGKTAPDSSVNAAAIQPGAVDSSAIASGQIPYSRMYISNAWSAGAYLSRSGGHFAWGVPVGGGSSDSSWVVATTDTLKTNEIRPVSGADVWFGAANAVIAGQGFFAGDPNTTTTGFLEGATDLFGFHGGSDSTTVLDPNSACAIAAVPDPAHGGTYVDINAPNGLRTQAGAWIKAALEVDGIAQLDGAVTMGDAAGDSLQPKGTFSADSTKGITLRAKGSNYVTRLAASRSLGASNVFALPNNTPSAGQVVTALDSRRSEWATPTGGAADTTNLTTHTEDSALRFKSTLTQTGKITANGALEVNGGVALIDSARVTGPAVFNGTTKLNGAVTAVGALTAPTSWVPGTALDWGTAINGIRARPFYYQDFLQTNGTTYSYMPWFGGSISSGTNPAGSPTANHPGVITPTAAVGANSGYYISTNATAFLLGGGECFSVVYSPVAVSRSGNRYLARMGYHDATTSAAPVDGVYLQQATTTYAAHAESLTIKGRTASNSTRDSTSTGYAATAGAWYRVVGILNSDATRVDFYVYNEAGAELWTDYVTTQIPTGAGRYTGNGVEVTATLGNSNAMINIDSVAMWMNARSLTR